MTYNVFREALHLTEPTYRIDMCTVCDKEWLETYTGVFNTPTTTARSVSTKKWNNVTRSSTTKEFIANSGDYTYTMEIIKIRR